MQPLYVNPDKNRGNSLKNFWTNLEFHGKFPKELLASFWLHFCKIHEGIFEKSLMELFENFWRKFLRIHEQFPEKFPEEFMNNSNWNLQRCYEKKKLKRFSKKFWKFRKRFSGEFLKGPMAISRRSSWYFWEDYWKILERISGTTSCKNYRRILLGISKQLIWNFQKLL